MPRADKQQIGEDVKTAQLGWPLGMPLIRKIEKDLWEVRTRLANGIARVFFTVDGELHDLAAWLYQKIAEDSTKRPEDSNDTS